jgi:hypothetical protein
MSRCRVVAPDVVRLPLSDGDSVEVKKILNAGEYRKLIYDPYKETPDGDKVVLDHSKLGMAKLLAYIVGWTFVGFDGAPLPYRPDEPEEIRRATIDGLDQDTYRELIAAVNAHEEREEAALEAQKKTRITAPAS